MASITTPSERTPFTRQKSGLWRLSLDGAKGLIYGHRFNAEIGYRVYIQFEDSKFANIFLPDQAKKMANLINSNGRKPTVDEITLSSWMHKMANEVEKLNDAWAALGMPSLPIDQIGECGHA